MSIPPLDRFEHRYDLGTSIHGTVALFHRQDIYRDRIFDFALKLIIVIDGEDVEVERIDCCHREVHRHRLRRDGSEDRVLICPFTPGDHRLVTIEHDRALDDYLATWEYRVGQWEEDRL